MLMSLIFAAYAQTCPSMQGEWTCYYKKNRAQTWKTTIVDQTQPGGPLTVQVTSQVDGGQPSVFVADGQWRPAPANFGNGQVRSLPHVNRCGGIKSEFDVVVNGAKAKIEQYLYPESGGVVRIFRQVAPLKEFIPEISCGKPRRPAPPTPAPALPSPPPAR